MIQVYSKIRFLSMHTITFGPFTQQYFQKPSVIYVKCAHTHTLCFRTNTYHCAMAHFSCSCDIIYVPTGLLISDHSSYLCVFPVKQPLSGNCWLCIRQHKNEFYCHRIIHFQMNKHCLTQKVYVTHNRITSPVFPLLTGTTKTRTAEAVRVLLFFVQKISRCQP